MSRTGVVNGLPVAGAEPEQAGEPGAYPRVGVASGCSGSAAGAGGAVRSSPVAELRSADDVIRQSGEVTARPDAEAVALWGGLSYARVREGPRGWPAPVVACGMGTTDALARVGRSMATASAIVALAERAQTLPPSAGGSASLTSMSSALPAARVLRVGDFAPVPPSLAELFLAAEGAVSGAGYLVTAEAFGPPGQLTSTRLEPTSCGASSGPPGPHLVQEAVRQIVAQDAALRWFASPVPRLVSVRGLLPQVLPAGTLELMAADGVDSFAWAYRDLGFDLVIVLLQSAGGMGCSVGIGVGSNLRSGLRQGFLGAACRRKAVQDLLAGRLAPVPELVQLLAPWFSGSQWLELMTDHTRAAEPTSSAVDDLATGTRGVDWVDVATRRFGHEPLTLLRPAGDGLCVVRAACPGSIVHRRQGRPSCPS
jgi:hypothetical protein